MYAVHIQFTLSIALHLHSKPQILKHVCHSTQRGRLIGWRQFLKTVASAHWKHPRTHSPWEDPPEHKSSSDPLAFQLTPKHHIVLILWYILIHCQLCCDFVVIHRTFQAKSFNISGLDSKGTSVHPRDSRRKMWLSTPQVLTAETPNEPFGFVPCPHPWPDGKSPTVLEAPSQRLSGPKRCLQLQVATSVRTFATARYAPFWWDVFLIQLLSVFLIQFVALWFFVVVPSNITERTGNAHVECHCNAECTITKISRVQPCKVCKWIKRTQNASLWNAIGVCPSLSIRAERHFRHSHDSKQVCHQRGWDARGGSLHLDDGTRQHFTVSEIWTEWRHYVTINPQKVTWASSKTHIAFEALRRV